MALAVVVALVAALFAYMATNIRGSEVATVAAGAPNAEEQVGTGAAAEEDPGRNGDDAATVSPSTTDPRGRCPEDAAAGLRRATYGRPAVEDGCAPADDAGPGSETAPGATTDSPPLPTDPPPPSSDQLEPVDAEAFCDGGRGVSALELEIAAALMRGDGSVAAVVVRSREAWRGDVERALTYAPPYLTESITIYRDLYSTVFEQVDPAMSDAEVGAIFDEHLTNGFRIAVKQFSLGVTEACG